MVVNDPVIRPRLQRVLLDAFDALRAGEHVDRSTLRGTLQMLVDVGIKSRLGVYVSLFETP